MNKFLKFDFKENKERGGTGFATLRLTVKNLLCAHERKNRNKKIFSEYRYAAARGGGHHTQLRLHQHTTTAAATTANGHSDTTTDAAHSPGTLGFHVNRQYGKVSL